MGSKKSDEYKVWVSMRGRCSPNSRPEDVRLYAARGIRVCKKWDSFDAFLSDMGPRPSPHHSIDRINNDRGYEPRNCRWATIGEQNRNKRTTVMITAFGDSKIAADWMLDARCAAQSTAAIAWRIRHGWDHERAITTPRVFAARGILSEADVLRIRSLYGKVRTAVIAEEFGLVEGTVVKIGSRKTWKNIK